MKWLFITSFLLVLSAVVLNAAEEPFEDHHTEEPQEELAGYMVDLQTLTHKLGLSIEAKNRPLIRFYLHESRVLIEEIQHKIPSYEGVPVALYMDRMALPAYDILRELYDAPVDSPSYFEHIEAAYDGLINSCNACHTSSDHEYIRIARNSHNPFLQDFSARE